jgi:hypothetical protein
VRKAGHPLPALLRSTLYFLLSLFLCPARGCTSIRAAPRRGSLAPIPLVGNAVATSRFEKLLVQRPPHESRPAQRFRDCSRIGARAHPACLSWLLARHGSRSKNIHRGKTDSTKSLECSRARSMVRRTATYDDAPVVRHRPVKHPASGLTAKEAPRQN